jgi:hypothetical protein
MKEQIREYMAKTFFATAWADYQEQALGEGLQGEIMDQIPDTYPESAYSAADKLIAGLEKVNGTTLETIFQTCRDEPGDHHREPDEDEFGYCMAMQAMGHGVGWDDNHPAMFHEKRIDWVEPKINRPQRFKVPSMEYTYFDLPDSEYPITSE